MNRDPSIHLTMSNFRDICKELEIEIPVSKFFRLATRKAINSRSILVSNDKLQKKVTKVLLADKGDAAMVAQIIYAIRVKLKHRGVRQINEASGRDWENCKKLADICNTFCQDFEFENIREGFIKYIERGINRMEGNNKNLLARLINMSDNISEQYACEIELREDPNPWATDQLFDYYVNKIAQVTGIYDNAKDPNKLIFFKRVCDKLNYDTDRAKQWIDAQFYALSFCNGIPAPKDLIGEKALERYNKYLYKIKNGGDEELPDSEVNLSWDKIK